MDVQMIRRGLEETREQLARIEKEREVLLNLQKGFEGWLLIHEPTSAAGEDSSLVGSGGPMPKPVSRLRFRTKGDIPYVDAIRIALEEANGQSLTREAIAKRAAELGAKSEAKDILGLVDTMSKRIGAERGDGPKTWRLAPTLAEKEAARRTDITAGRREGG